MVSLSFSGDCTDLKMSNLIDDLANRCDRELEDMVLNWDGEIEHELSGYVGDGDRSHPMMVMKMSDFLQLSPMESPAAIQRSGKLRELPHGTICHFVSHEQLKYGSTE